MTYETAMKCAERNVRETQKSFVVYLTDNGDFGQVLLEYWKDPTLMQEFPWYFDECEEVTTIHPQELISESNAQGVEDKVDGIS